MPLFPRKQSREAGLQRIYTEAYQSSLQSILKESSFEFQDSLYSWKQTLSQITAGMAKLDGSPPKTGQEKSLLASIMDIERQCHDRIAALETRLQSGNDPSVSRSPYGTHVSNPSAPSISNLSLNEKRKPSRVAVGAKGPRPEPVKSEPVLPKPQGAPSSGSTSPALDFTNNFVSHMPSVNEMPYQLYAKKPSISPVHPETHTRSVPVLASEAATSKSKADKKQPVQHRSSLEYPQPAPAQHSHSMLTTLRSKNPLKSRNRSSGSHTQARRTPSPRTSAENVAITAAKQTVAAATAASADPTSPRGDSPNLQQFAGFEGAFRSGSQPESPTMASPVEGQGNAFSNFSPPVPKSQLYQQQQQQQSSSRNSPANAPAGNTTKRTQFQVAYEKMSTSGGRTVYRPRIIRTQPTSSQSSGSYPAAKGQPPREHSNSPHNSVLADGAPELDAAHEDLANMDDWDIMVQQKIKELRGVDKTAAQQIVNEVVLKGDKVNWDDIAGLEKAKASLKETVVYPFLRPDLFMGLREPVLGMLLFGPPGTGKTMLARAVATESKSTFFSISASSLTSKYMGESEKLVRALFQLAKALAPSIIFVDEIDSILTQRADSGEHEASRRIKNEFLVQWSDLQAAAAGKSHQDAKRVLVLGATNLPWAIDEAARRRFVRRQYIPLPEPYTRRVHLEKLLSHQKHALTDADLAELTELTDGYSGSDLTALAKDAAMGPLRSLGDALLTTAPDQIRPMGMYDFVESMKSIRPSVSSEGLRAFEQWADMYGSSGA